MQINRELARNAFDEYVNQYNASDEKIKLKIWHTYRVCELCERIARESGLDAENIDLAWLLGLLHDIGRFEQVKQYGTFIDSQSVDHAQFGADILFHDQMIKLFVEDFSENELIEKVIKYHSAYRLPAELTHREKLFANILRDADKIDILKVNVIVPLEEIYNVTTKALKESVVSDEVLEDFLKEHAILRSLKKTPVDHVVGHISLAYELVYPVSFYIVVEQGYLDEIMHFESENQKTQQQFELIRNRMNSYMEKRMKMMKSEMDLKLILRMQGVIRQCGELMLEADRSQALIEQKEGHANFVTTYDKMIQEILKEKLLELLPNAIFMGEEDETYHYLQEGFVFIVDPIDGTTNFMKDYHMSAISIGLLKDGKPYIGIIYNPYLDELFIAQKDCGAYLNGKPIHVSQNTLNEGIVLFGTSPYYEHLAKKSFDTAYEYFAEALDVRRSGSAALDLCSIAAGRAELYFEMKLSPWDYAAGCLLVEEAGGKVTQMDGAELIFNEGCSVLATNGIASKK